MPKFKHQWSIDNGAGHKNIFINLKFTSIFTNLKAQVFLSNLHLLNDIRSSY